MGGARALGCAGVAAILCLSTEAAGQAAVEMASCCMSDVPRTSTAIEIDGVLDEAAWADALVLQLTVETNPGENIPAEVETHAYLLEDGERFLVAFDARDPDPAAIRAYLRDRDSAYADDFVGVVIDTFNDERRAFEFFANALGVQMDGRLAARCQRPRHRPARRRRCRRRNVERNLALHDDPDTDAETLTIGAQLLYAYKLNPQTVFFLGYTDSHRDDDDLLELTQTERSVFMKLSYAWAPWALCGTNRSGREHAAGGLL